MESVSIDARLCKACLICVETCPRGVFSTEPAEGGRTIPIVRAPERCTSCRICELYCPEFAVRVR